MICCIRGGVQYIRDVQRGGPGRGTRREVMMNGEYAPTRGPAHRNFWKFRIFGNFKTF